jgi:predicted metalloprotease with PDZ domain
MEGSEWIQTILLVGLLIPGLTGQPLIAQEPVTSTLEIAYTVRLPQPTTHLVEVEILVRKVVTPALDMVIPAWAPGRYAIYDFAKSVQEFAPRGSNDDSLPWQKIDKQTWRIDTRQAGGTIKVRYRVFSNDLTGSFSQVDGTHANLNGPSIFMYVDGHKPDPVTLKVDAPATWKVISGYSISTTDRSFHAPNYDAMVDTPLEISPDCTVDQFEEQGKTIRVAVHDFAGGAAGQSDLVEGLKKIVHAEMSAMPAPDFQHYLFIFHFAPELSLGDGMEHLNSTQIIIQSNLRLGYHEALETAAHEFFHVWNVKRLRPASLGPFDYTRENHSRSLWFAEGVTTYYGYLFLLKSGVWTRQQFLDGLTNEITNLEREPGRQLMSAESSSFNAWFFDRSPQMQETNFANTTISYYNKGAILGMLLDLEVRSRTRGQKTLLDVLSTMYHKFYESPAASYYGPGRGYEEADLLDGLNAVTHSDFAPFFDRYVRGTDELPYDETLRAVGFELHSAMAPDPAPSLGVLLQPEALGARISAVIPGGAAERAGLSRDDLLIDVDDQSLVTESLSTRLRAYPAGAKVPITFERHGRRESVTVTLDPPLKTYYSIVPVPSPTPEQDARRSAWLGK